MRTLFISISIILGLSLSSCSKQETFIVKGQVINKHTGEAISNAELRVIGFTNGSHEIVESKLLAIGESNDIGYFTVSFESDERPNYYLKVEKEGMEAEADMMIEQAFTEEAIMYLKPINLQ